MLRQRRNALVELRLTVVIPKSYEKVISKSGIKKEDIDLVVFAGKKAGLFYTLTKPPALFSVEDWIYQNEKYWKPKLIEKKNLNSFDDFKLFEHKVKDIEKNPYFELVEQVKKILIQTITKY